MTIPERLANRELADEVLRPVEELPPDVDPS